MKYKATYLCEGQECKEWLADADALVLPVPPTKDNPSPFGGTERPPTIQEVVTEVRKNGGFWRGQDFIPYHNIRSIESEKY
jgi:hypothetical protein